MSNISEYIYEVIAAVLMCLGLTFCLALYESATNQETITVQQNFGKENIAESTDGYQGDNLISGATVISNIMATGGTVTTYVDGQEIPKPRIQDSVDKKDASILQVAGSIELDATYEVTYTQDEENAEVKSVSYTKQS